MHFNTQLITFAIKTYKYENNQVNLLFFYDLHTKLNRILIILIPNLYYNRVSITQIFFFPIVQKEKTVKKKLRFF